MISVLISIKPKWCELIASGKKTIEVRKTKPKIDTPFKVYIYCTKQFYRQGDGYFQGKHCGKVIGEFVCRAILNYECEFVDDDCYEEIASVALDEDDGSEYGFIEWSNDGDISYENTFFHKTSHVGYEELKTYMGVGFGKFYAWHISDLVIYDKPKELCEFYRHDTTYDNSFGWAFEDRAKKSPITRPPQSWCYVEKGGEE